jgi:uncharacterized protein (DUF433 family)
MPPESVITEHIEITPGVCGGKPRISGHRIRVQDIVIWHERMGLSPDEILLHYPTITLADVYAALAYYHDHRDEIQQQIHTGEAFAAQLQAKTRSVLQRKLTELDSLSSADPPLTIAIVITPL